MSFIRFYSIFPVCHNLLNFCIIGIPFRGANGILVAIRMFQPFDLIVRC